ncbi:hypothetical protein KC325_g69 [Hortaea werneckii]|nr:hypothetical protein KC325_g69 [Hortaea werneckii]
MRRFGDRDTGNADVLGLDVFALLNHRRWATSSAPLPVRLKLRGAPYPVPFMGPAAGPPWTRTAGLYRTIAFCTPSGVPCTSTIRSLALVSECYVECFEQVEYLRCAVGDKAIRMAHAIEGAGDSQDAVVHTRYNLADASTDTSLVAKVCYVLASLTDDDTGFLGRDNGAQGELGLAVLLVVLRALNDAASRGGEETSSADMVLDEVEVVRVGLGEVKTGTAISIGTVRKLQLGQVSGVAHRNKGGRSELTFGITGPEVGERAERSGRDRTGGRHGFAGEVWRGRAATQASSAAVLGRSGAPGSLFRQSLAKVLPVEGKGLAARPTFLSRSPRRFPAFESVHTAHST